MGSRSADLREARRARAKVVQDGSATARRLVARAVFVVARRGRRFKARRIRVDRPETPPARLSEEAEVRMALGEIEYGQNAHLS